MKYLLLFLSFNAFAEFNDQGQVVEDRVTVDCQGERGALNFRLNRSTQVAVFENKQAMFRAELPLGEPIATLIDGADLKITYDYDFVAEYTLTFAKPIKSLRAGERVAMTLDGDDNDGFIFNQVPFRCSVK